MIRKEKIRKTTLQIQVCTHSTTDPIGIVVIFPTWNGHFKVKWWVKPGLTMHQPPANMTTVEGICVGGSMESHSWLKHVRGKSVVKAGNIERGRKND